ncbi:unnamed protein product [Pleuronectes platessa]|uniref:Uncharacterized protein n=1 Tax=Pleuronectes platessa TaxID=8262 RepID=A0A9N7W4R5_PLEPL|nr:unnamed protein product [Pleuronectes platessa]
MEEKAAVGPSPHRTILHQPPLIILLDDVCVWEVPDPPCVRHVLAPLVSPVWQPLKGFRGAEFTGRTQNSRSPFHNPSSDHVVMIRHAFRNACQRETFVYELPEFHRGCYSIPGTPQKYQRRRRPLYTAWHDATFRLPSSCPVQICRELPEIGPKARSEASRRVRVGMRSV